MDQYFKQAWQKLGDNIVAVLLGLSILALILIGIGITGDSKNLLVIFCLEIGRMLFGVSIFTFLLKSRAFTKTILEVFDIKSRHWGDYNLDTIEKVMINISKSFPQIECNGANLRLRHESKEIARQDFIDMQSKLIKKRDRASSELSDDDERLLKRNFFISESKITKTVLINGTEISTFELDIEILKDGSFCFIYSISTLFDNVVFPKFDEYIKNAQEIPTSRFNDFSFSCRILEFRRRNNLLTHNETPRLSAKAIKEDDSGKSKTIEISLSPECLNGDTFRLAFSLSTKGEFTKENIKLATANENYRSKSTSITPIGVRSIIIQEETYSTNGQKNLRPSLRVGDAIIEASSNKENMFYNNTGWTIYYSKYRDSSKPISYSVV